jgi:DNA polymerase elongation subunit (family B)
VVPRIAIVHRPPPSPDPPAPLYGLDIETDTATGGLDPHRSAIIAVAVSTEDRSVVLTGPEPELLGDVEDLLAGLEPGIIVTWNGGAFDLPYLADRARRTGVALGLRLEADHALRTRTPLPGHGGSYRATWGRHRHLDAYRVYRNDLDRWIDVSCSLKSVARLLGFRVPVVDASRVHELDAEALAAYVSSDAFLARKAALARWSTAAPFVDPVALVASAPGSAVRASP